MLDAHKRKNLAALAKQKKTTQSPSAKGKKLKAVTEVALFEDEETCFGLVFKRKQTDAAAVSVHFASDGRAPSYQDFPPNPSPPHDIAVQEGRGESASEGDH